MNKPAYLDEKFNRNVLTVVCLVGLLRIILELERNTPQSGIIDFYLDLSYGILFLITLTAIALKYSYKFICLSFYIPLVILLCLTLIDRKGLASSIENNIHIGLIVISLTMRGPDARKFSALLILGTAISLVIVEFQYGFLEDYSGYSKSNFNFVFMGIGTVFVIYYAKRVFERNKVSLSEIESYLAENQKDLDRSNAQLEVQTTELEDLNRELEVKVEVRKAVLNNQKLAMQDYLKVTLEELSKEHSSFQNSIHKTLDTGDEISKMIMTSTNRLNAEIDSLMKKLKSDQ